MMKKWTVPPARGALMHYEDFCFHVAFLLTFTPHTCHLFTIPPPPPPPLSAIMVWFFCFLIVFTWIFGLGTFDTVIGRPSSSANWRKTAVLAPAENSASVIFFRLRISENPRSDPIELTSPIAIYETSSGVRKREYFPLVALRISETRLSLDLYPVDLRPFDFWRQNCLKLVGSLATSWSSLSLVSSPFLPVLEV